jgi:hypothetical protein
MVTCFECFGWNRNFCGLLEMILGRLQFFSPFLLGGLLGKCVHKKGICLEQTKILGICIIMPMYNKIETCHGAYIHMYSTKSYKYCFTPFTYL